jgi:hypothetical protein
MDEEECPPGLFLSPNNRAFRCNFATIKEGEQQEYSSLLILALLVPQLTHLISSS